MNLRANCFNKDMIAVFHCEGFLYHLHVCPQGGDSVPHDVQRPIPLGWLIASPRGEGGGLHLSTTGIEQPEKKNT